MNGPFRLWKSQPIYTQNLRDVRWQVRLAAIWLTWTTVSTVINLCALSHLRIPAAWSRRPPDLPRFTVEAAPHQSPFDILFQTPQSGTRFDAHPDHVRAANRRKGAKTLYR